ncbi:MAG TPA: hypothetical protein VMI94_00625 [Bryobacteraceae bacterium]|nr:hypothetical protein [Bryobacteraceae bacterium]
MKSLRFTLLSSLALALLGPCFTAGLANAQGFTGKFSLPCDAHWGLATLAAGDYSFILDRAPGGSLHLFRGTKTVAMIYAQSFNQLNAGRPALLLVNDGTATTIREMRLPTSGMVLYYAPHKPKRGSAQEERQTAQLVPMTVTGAAQ